MGINLGKACGWKRKFYTCFASGDQNTLNFTFFLSDHLYIPELAVAHLIPN